MNYKLFMLYFSMCCECLQLKCEKSSLEQENSCLQTDNKRLEQELNLALQTINMMRYRMFGRSSEQINPGQGQFDSLLAECDSLNGESPEENPETEKIEYSRRKKNDKRNGRVKIPDHLERVEKFIDLPESEKICPVTGLPMIKIGEEISEQLAYEPGRIYAIRYIRPKYASPDRRGRNIYPDALENSAACIIFSLKNQQSIDNGKLHIL